MVLQILPSIRSLCRIYKILSIWRRFLICLLTSLTSPATFSSGLVVKTIVCNKIRCGHFLDMKSRHLSYGWDLNRCAYTDQSLWTIDLTANFFTLLDAICVTNILEIIISWVGWLINHGPLLILFLSLFWTPCSRSITLRPRWIYSFGPLNIISKNFPSW